MTLSKPMMIVAATFLVAAAPPQAKSGSPAPAPAPAPTAPAKPTPRATTVGCILASNVFVQREPDATKKALAGQTLAFYLGRLSPALSAAQFKTELKSSAETLKGVDAAALMNECLVDLRTKAQMLQTVGQQIQQGK